MDAEYSFLPIQATMSLNPFINHWNFISKSVNSFPTIIPPLGGFSGWAWMFWISNQRFLIAISICSCASSILNLKSSFTSPAFLALSPPSLPHTLTVIDPVPSRPSFPGLPRQPGKAPLDVYSPAAHPFCFEGRSLGAVSKVKQRGLTFTQLLLHICNGTGQRRWHFFR